MRPYLTITTTTDSAELAQRIGYALVEDRLAACVQIDGPLRSTYRWQGTVERAREWRLSIKTRSELFDAVSAAIASRHTYELPEILATPVAEGEERYLTWLDEQCERRD